ncbi:hypothetical protein C8T65DRAFT_76864 [Cerioporus squamosus]|nr:hypothetical protein C8T65DRAFT_76864 [Cerioporus squamosus]
MSWLNELYQRLVIAALANDASAAQGPITIRIVYPARIGTLVTRLPGGGVQTADVVLPGCVVTLVVAQVTPLDSPGGAPLLADASASSASATHLQGQQASGRAAAPADVSPSPAYDAPQHAHASVSGTSTFESLPPGIGFASSDAQQHTDPSYASLETLPRASQCSACAAAVSVGTPCSWCGRAEHEDMPIDPELFPAGESHPSPSFPLGGVVDGDLLFSDPATMGMYPQASEFGPGFYSPSDSSYL